MHIVMTGATSGIGLHAATALLKLPNVRLTIAARTPAKAPSALRAAIFQTVDLADLQSVGALAQILAPTRGQGAPIDRLILNAGVQNVGTKLSAQGFELSFAVNHLSHYLLLRLLLTHIAPGGRIVLTSSGTHDPAEGTPVTPPRHADAARLAHPANDPERPANAIRRGQFAYSSSKLCNVMTARELARRLAPVRPDIMVAAFDPGFTPGTGLARQYGAVVSGLFRFVLPLVARGQRTSTPAISGAQLAALAGTGPYATARGDYFAVRGKALLRREPSELARDAIAAEKLWIDSAEMVGLPAALQDAT